MASDRIVARVLDLLSSKAGDGRELGPESGIAADAGLDSVSVMDVVLELEDEFDVTIPLDSLADVRTVADLAGVIASLRAQSA